MEDNDSRTIIGQKRQNETTKAKAEKKRKWEAKQARKKLEDKRESVRKKWFDDNAEFATLITDGDIESIKDSEKFLDKDVAKKRELLLPYFDVQENASKHRSKGNSLTDDLFIAEGTETIRILIQQLHDSRKDYLQPIELRSIFVKPNLLFEQPVNLLSDVADAIKKESSKTPGFHVLVGSERVLSKIAGFTISRGALACGVIPLDRNEDWLANLVEKRLRSDGRQQLRLLAMDSICDTSNMGSMIRCASAFGVDAVVVSEDTCECWYRRSIRVSMGHVFKVPVVRVKNIAQVLRTWSSTYPQLQSYAAVVDTECLLERIARGEVPRTWCCVVGNEGQGISKEVADACTQKVRISMSEGVDSLSVPIACGILLHGLKERESS